jgi:hypothetical protein
MMAAIDLSDAKKCKKFLFFFFFSEGTSLNLVILSVGRQFESVRHFACQAEGYFEVAL